MFKTQLKFYFILLFFLMVGIIAGYKLSLFLERDKIYNQALEQGVNQGLEKGRSEIEEKYQTKIKELFPTPIESKEVSSFSGKIKEIKDGTLFLEIILYPSSPFQEPKIEMKTVDIAQNTEIAKGVLKSREETIQEAGALSEIIEDNPKADVPSLDPYKKGESILFSDLKIGDMVKVEVGENTKNKAEFTAKTIIVIP
jgi:hypothetical protein